MITTFRKGLEYGNYSLCDTNGISIQQDLNNKYKTKKNSYKLITSIKAYEGSNGIEFLAFLGHLKDALNVFVNLEAVGVRVLSYYHEDESKSLCTAQMNLSPIDQGVALQKTWPYVVDILIKRFLSETVFREAFNGVARARHGD